MIEEYELLKKIVNVLFTITNFIAVRLSWAEFLASKFPVMKVFKC